MIDCRALILDADRLALVARASRRHRPPLALLVTPEQATTLPAYVDDVVPVTTDPAVVPPPASTPVVEVPPVPLADAVVARIAELQQQVRNHVDAALPPSEREALASIAAGLAEKVAFGASLTPTEQGVAVGLMQARAWTTAALALAGDAAVHCAACTTLEELQAFTIDLTVLGEAPSVTAGEVARVLRDG
jgi:hypothetical protein